MVEDGGLDAAGSCDGQKAKGDFCQGRYDQSRSMGKDGMRRGARMVPPLAAICFGRVLECLNVICYGYDWETDEQERRQCNKLDSPVGAIGGSKTQPLAEHQRGEPNPGEIEEQLHPEVILYHDGLIEKCIGPIVLDNRERRMSESGLIFAGVFGLGLTRKVGGGGDRFGIWDCDGWEASRLTMMPNPLMMIKAVCGFRHPGEAWVNRPQSEPFRTRFGTCCPLVQW